MTRIQEVIYKFEVGEGVWALRLVVGLLLLATLTVWYDLNEFQNFRTSEAMEATQLARNLARGEGFTTRCLRPLTISLVQDQQGIAGSLSRQPHPDLVNPPAYPVLLAGLMKLLPFRYEISPRFWRYQPEMLIALFNQLLFFVTVWATFRLARRLFDFWTALTTAIVLLGSDILWRFSVSGLSTHLLLLILVGLLWALTWLEQGTQAGPKSAGWYARLAFAIGALLGVGALTRYSFAWLLLPTLVCCYLWAAPRRWLVCSVVTATLLLFLAPWVARNHALSGTFFGVPGFAVHQETMPFPETRLERSLNPELNRIEPRDYVRKVCGNTGDIMQSDLPRLGGGSWIAAFFLVGLFLRFRNPSVGRLRLFLVLSLPVFIAVQAIGHTHLSTDVPWVNSENLLVLLLPGVCIFGTAMFFVLLDQLRLAILELRYLAIVVFLVISSAQLLWTLLPPRTYALVYPPYLPPWIQETASYLQPQELMMSDMPWAVAWYGDRNCCWTTLDVSKSFFTINDEHKAISALYLTPLTTDARLLTQIIQGQDYDWSRFAIEIMTRTNLPAEFPLRHARRKYTPDQLFLCDRPRWQEPKR